MTIRRTPAELKEFNKIVTEYVKEGYPEWYAKDMAWDFFHINRQLKRGVHRSKVL